MKVSDEAEEGELTPQALDENRQKYKDMLSSLALRDATEEDYRKTRGVGQPYRGMTRPPWQEGRFTRCGRRRNSVN